MACQVGDSQPAAEWAAFASLKGSGCLRRESLRSALRAKTGGGGSRTPVHVRSAEASTRVADLLVSPTTPPAGVLGRPLAATKGSRSSARQPGVGTSPLSSP